MLPIGKSIDKKQAEDLTIHTFFYSDHLSSLKKD
jgi:hypothetical protein